MYVSVNLHKLVFTGPRCQYFIRDNFHWGVRHIVSLKSRQKIKPNLKMVKLISYFCSAPTKKTLRSGMFW